MCLITTCSSSASVWWSGERGRGRSVSNSLAADWLTGIVLCSLVWATLFPSYLQSRSCVRTPDLFCSAANSSQIRAEPDEKCIGLEPPTTPSRQSGKLAMPAACMRGSASESHTGYGICQINTCNHFVCYSIDVCSANPLTCVLLGELSNSLFSRWHRRWALIQQNAAKYLSLMSTGTKQPIQSRMKQSAFITLADGHT